MAGSSTNTFHPSAVDDLYFSALSDDANLDVFPISDANYADALQFQEVLLSSLLSSAPPHHQRLVCSSPSRPLTLSSPPEEGECSKSSLILCEICAEAKPPNQMFQRKTCEHLFCNDCIGRHVAVKLQESVSTVLCPGLNCRAVLEPEQCRDVVPDVVFERWGSALCESAVLGFTKLYCPYRECSTLFVLDGDDEDGGDGEITQAECVCCRRLFCAKCNVPWHAGVECREYQRLGCGDREREDLMLVEVANNKKWKRCPSCGFYVEKTEGCLHIVCRCTFQFCYGCGSQWSTSHTACHT